MLVFFEGAFVDDFVRGGRFLETLAVMSAPPAQRSCAASPREFDGMLRIADAMRDELRAVRADTEHALRAETYRLLVSLQRASAPTARAPTRAPGLVQRFEMLVGESFARQHRVDEYARRLGVTPRHLNGCVRDVLGITASEAIHRRQFLEARRLLVHTSLGVGAIADELGFSEASWFIRFFKRRAGMTPLAFRRRHESDISVPMSALPRPPG